MKLSVPSFLAKKEIDLKLFNGTDANGENIIAVELSVGCRLELANGTTYTKEGKRVPLSGKVFIFDKLGSFPDEVSGTCKIGTVNYDIAKASVKHNPDGTVNHIVLELM